MNNILHPAYAAGILDGEGTFFIANSSGKCFFPCVQVGMTDPAIPALFHATYGGYLDERGHYGPKAAENSHKWAKAYYWRVQKADLCLTVIADVWPYLLLKKPQAAVIVSLLAYAPNLRRGRRPITDDELAFRYQMRDLTRSLNRRGPGEKIEIPEDILPSADAFLASLRAE